MIADVRDACTPRSDVLAGGLEDKHFAAQLDQVVIGAAGYEAYADAEQFFALTYPTQGGGGGGGPETTGGIRSTS